AGEVDEGPSANDWAGIAHSGSNSSCSVAGQCLYRNPGTAAPASVCNFLKSITQRTQSLRKRTSPECSLELIDFSLQIFGPVQFLRALQFFRRVFSSPHIAVSLTEQIMSRGIVRLHGHGMFQGQSGEIVVAFFLQDLSHQDERHA